jgi:hypothetical protein
MMVGVDEAWHDDRIAGVYDFGLAGWDVDADGDDTRALDKDVAGRQIRDIAIHRDDDASFEEGAAPVLRAHGWNPS